MAEKILDLDPFILAAEKKQDLPPGLLRQIIDEAGTGIPPKARASILEKFGLDAKLSNANAVEAAGILLSDALANNKGDAGLALAEYRSGKDRAEWGTDTAKFVRRVRSGRGVNMAQVGTPQRGPSTAPATPAPAPAPVLPNMSALGASTGSVTPVPVDPVQMGTPSVTGSGVDVGKLMQSTGEVQKFEAPPPPPPSRTQVAEAPGMDAIIPAAAGEPEGPHTARPESLASYADGTMPAERRAQMRDLVKSGDLLVPEGFSMEEPGMVTRATAAVKGAANAVGEMVTGKERRTAATESANDLSLSPEWAALNKSVAIGPADEGMGTKVARGVMNATGLGTVADVVGSTGRIMADPAEQIQILKANNPSLETWQDEKGNWFMRSANGEVFSSQPGFRATDLPKAAASVAAFLPAGGAPGIVGGALANAGTQAVIEAGQAAQGGEFSGTEVGLAGLGGAIVPAVGKAKEGLKAALTSAPVTEVAPSVARAVLPDEELADLAVKASGTGKVADEAKRALAQQMDVNPDLVKKAADLGFDLPVDVLSSNKQIQEAIGGLRSKVGSEASASFANSVEAAVKRADDVIADLGGESSPAGVSARVQAALDSARVDLQGQAKALYNDVDAVIPMVTPVQLPNLRKTIEAIAKETKGAPLDKETAKLARLLDADEVAYGALREEKELIRKALVREESPYGSMSEARLTRLSNALKEDQLANAERLGGAELRSKLRLANQLTYKHKLLGERLVKAFGREGEGSIAALMQRALTGASKGDITALNKLLKGVPKEMHGEVLMTAISSLSRSKEGASRGAFGLAQFNSFYEGLRQPGNEQIYKTVVDALGKDRADVMQNMFEVTKALERARNMALKTGKANQTFADNVAAESLMDSVLKSAGGKAVTGAAGALAGGAVAGPLGAAGGAGLAATIVEALAKGGPEAVNKAGKLFVSDEFKALAIEAGMNKTVTPAAIRKVAASQRWRDFAKAANMPRDPKAGEQFLSAALQAARQTRGEQ
jgi:hypothetical protein